MSGRLNVIGHYRPITLVRQQGRNDRPFVVSEFIAAARHQGYLSRKPLDHALLKSPSDFMSLPPGIEQSSNLVQTTRFVQKMRRANKYLVLLRALSRISLRMATYMVRRLLRNRLAAVFPNAYRARIGRIVTSLPELDLAAPPMESVRSIASFYRDEYKDAIADASRGRLTLFGKTIDFGSPSDIDWDIHLPEEGDHQLWNTKLGHMGFVGAMLLEPQSPYQDAVLEIVRSAYDRADMAAPGAFHSFWFPYAASHRILAIGSAYFLAKSQGQIRDDVAAVVEAFLRRNVAFVLDNIEHELCNNHVERNLAALSLFFSHATNVPRTLVAKLERHIAQIVRHTMLADGSQIERSPMYQGLSMASLEVMQDARFLSGELRAHLAEVYAGAKRAFAVVCHPDREIALFNDAWHGEVPHLNGAPAPDGRIILDKAGYARLGAGGDVCLLDAGPLGPSWNPGHGHSDFLSIEVSLGGQRLVVDPGTSRYNTGAERKWERSAAAHNGPTWKGYEPVEFLGCFKVGRMAAASLLPIGSGSDPIVAGSFVDRPGVMARAVRHFRGRGFLVVDLWLGAAPAEINWLLPASWSLTAASNGYSLEHQGSGISAVVSFGPQSVATQRHDGLHSFFYGHQRSAHRIQVTPLHRDASSYLYTWFGHAEITTEIFTQADIDLVLLEESVG